MAHVFVTNVDSKTISVIDSATNTVIATAPVDGPPIRIALTPDESRAYITMRAAHTGFLLVWDTTTHQRITQIAPTDFFIAGVAVTPDGRHAYVANSGNDHTVKVIDIASTTVTAEVPIDLSIDIAIAPDGKYAYTTDFDGVAVIDTATNTVATRISIGKGPVTGTQGRGIALTPDGATAYLTNGGLDTVSFIDTASHSETGSVAVGDDPLAVAVTPDGSRVFVTNNGSANVSVIDTATNTVTDTITVGDHPYGVAFTADGQRAFVANSGSNTVAVIDTTTNSVVAEIAAGTKPFAVAVAG